MSTDAVEPRPYGDEAMVLAVPSHADSMGSILWSGRARDHRVFSTDPDGFPKNGHDVVEAVVAARSSDFCLIKRRRLSGGTCAQKHPRAWFSIGRGGSW